MSLLDDILEEQDKKAPRELKNDWVSEIDGRPTFWGVMFRYYNEIIVGWNADTQKNYFWDYRRFLLPDLNGSPLESYTKEDFEKIFSLLPERKKAFNQVYHERVLRHFWHITNRVLKIASKNNICPNVLWGSEELLPEETDEEAAEKELVRLKKSLSIQEELQIAEQILVDPNQTGQRMGLALMFCLGLRNGEACGADFRDIHPKIAPPLSCADVQEQATAGSAKPRRKACSTGRASGRSGAWGNPNKRAGISQKDIPAHCLPTLSEISDIAGFSAFPSTLS